MHFHLPKPLHGWREFAGEVGIIVIGVLIALGAEQSIEAIHSHHRAEEAEQQLREELTSDFLIADERRFVHACLSAQVDALEQRVLAPTPTLAPAAMSHDAFGRYVYRAPSRPWSQSAWQTVRDGGILERLSETDRGDLNQTYTQLSVMQRMNDEEDNAVGELMALSRPLPLDPGVRAHFVELLENERRRADLMDVIAKQIMDQARTLNAAAHEQEVANYRSHSGTAAWCRAHGMLA